MSASVKVRGVSETTEAEATEDGGPWERMADAEQKERTPHRDVGEQIETI